MRYIYKIKTSKSTVYIRKNSIMDRGISLLHKIHKKANGRKID
jgi:hypothetical protein